MEINFFTDPNLIPHPREEIRITDVSLDPYPDAQRVRVEVTTTPFAPADRPSLEITAHNIDGTQVASLSIIEAVQNKVAVTVHLREDNPTSLYTFHVGLYYNPGSIQHGLSKTLRLLGGTPPANQESET